ncbi:MAG: helix-hairpin-helix domain-containing protein [Bacteroidota bacterium]
MNRLFKLLGLLTLSLFIYSCQSSEKKESSEETQETTEPSSTVAETETISEVTVINPNLASEEELKSVGLGEQLIKQVLENRPFITMADLDALIQDAMVDSTERVRLYAEFFVPLNLNTTPEDEFKLIPGVGDRMAHEFEEYRPYTRIQQFRAEIGKYVDESEIARFEKYVFVPIELNSASEEEILAIPGVGDRMAHEFEEYRPYQSMEQFRKEIGKYVDDKELSRLERFVYLKE